MNARTIVFTGKDQLEIIDEPIGRPGPGELLIETHRSIISTGTEGIVLTRNFAPDTHFDRWVKYPFHTGYLSAGRVLEVGSGVEGWTVGDRIAARGPHASHAIQRIARVAHIPDGVDDEDAAWMGLGKITQVGVRAAPHVLGDSVVIIELGLLGQLIVQYVRLLGAQDIIAIDTAPLRLQMAKAHGATHTLQMSAADALPEVEKITQGRRADVVYDVTGHWAVLPTALPLARKFGTLLLIGDSGTPQKQTLTPDVLSRGVRIVGVHDGHVSETPHEFLRWTEIDLYNLFLRYIADERMRVKDLVTHRYNPEAAREAYTMLQRQRETAMGVVFEWK